MTAAGHVPVAEHVAPPAGLEVRGEDDAAGLVAVRAGLKQESGPVDVDAQAAELVDDGQPGPADRLKLLVETVLVLGLPQAHDQARGGEEHDGDHAPAGEHADRDGQVGLAAAHVAVKHEVLGPARVLLLEQVGEEAELAGRGVLQGLLEHAVCQRQVAGESHDLFRRGLVKNAAAALPRFLLAHSASFMYLS